jgi:hypothetical protein
MQDWGKEVFKTLTGKNGTYDKGQYLVAAVLSDDDLNTPNRMPGRLLKGCPNDGPDHDKQMIMCSISGVFLNRESEDIWRKSRWSGDETYRDHEWHGEYILLNEGYVQQLVENFEGNQCQVYLYSYYIPCADIKGCPYWCSDEILKYNNRDDISCRITVIGYTEVFRRSNTTRTNEQFAVNNIESARAQLFKNVKKVKTKAIRDVKDRNRNVPFQELMFLCLNESPISACCVNLPGTSSSSSEELIAYYVNKMVFKAINVIKSDLTAKTKRDDYLTYFYHFIDKTISRDCSVCPYERYHKLVMKFCTKTAIELASGFGEPSESGDLSHSSWTFTGNRWNNLYRVSPEEFRKTKMLLCANRPMSVDSMCTRLDYEENRDPEQDEMMDFSDSDTIPMIEEDNEMDISDTETIPMDVD